MTHPFSSAEFSPCGKYRHSLVRIWDPPGCGKPMGCIIGKNPSVAGRENNDATMHKDIAFARFWGWRGTLKENLYDYIATDADDLLSIGDSLAVSPKGLIAEVIKRIIAEDCTEVVCAWGTHSNRRLRERIIQRGQNMKARLIEAGFAPKVLKMNADGTPAHTLYLPSSLRPIPWGMKSKELA